MSNLGQMAEQLRADLVRPATAIAGTDEGDLIRRSIVRAVKALENRELPWNTRALSVTLVDGQGTYARGAGTTITITGATAATPIVITATAHALKNGAAVTISGVVGVPEANGRFLVTNETANTFELFTFAKVAVAGTGAYVSGGAGTTAEYFIPETLVNTVETDWQLEDDDNVWGDESFLHVDLRRYKTLRIGEGKVPGRPTCFLLIGEDLVVNPLPGSEAAGFYRVTGRYVERTTSPSGKILDAIETAGAWSFGGAEEDAYTSDSFDLDKGYDVVLDIAKRIFQQWFLPKDDRAQSLASMAGSSMKRLTHVESRQRFSGHRRGHWPGDYGRQLDS